jgi:hypothetical protein
MHDDGRDGDERAGDGVWSLAATFDSGTRLSYAYTNSGAAGRWEGLDVPHIRSVTIPASPDGGPVYLPIETFGEVYMQADDWHTNAAGYDLIAHAVAQAIRSLKPPAASLPRPFAAQAFKPANGRARQHRRAALRSF